jgi:hypothetical protein
METDAPIRLKLLRETLEARLRKSTTDSELPRRAMPQIDTDDASRAKFLRESEAPT